MRDLSKKDSKVKKPMEEYAQLYMLLMPIILPLVKACFANKAREFAQVNTDIYNTHIYSSISEILFIE